MNTRKVQIVVIISLLTLILVSAMLATTAANTVPASRLDEYATNIDANAIKPPQCSAIVLTTILYCTSGAGNCDGTDANELVIGTAADDDIQGGKGDDCILGGGGNDSIKGEQDTDVCIGGPGNDSFHPSCETEIQ